MFISGREFDTGNKCYIMGILNMTPDSFSDGGKWKTLDDALRQAEKMVSDGAAIIDVGGESSRPGSARISEQEEIDRTVHVIEALHSRVGAPISIDTCKSVVADAALRAGAGLVNDIWGLKFDPDMAVTIARAGAACCLMHNRNNMDYSDFIQDMLGDLRESAAIAKGVGIADDKIILDPGIGFAKTYETNLEAINCIDKIVELGYPVLLGTSRKRVVGKALDLPVSERVEGTLATTVIGIMKGCSFVRVHDVKETNRAVIMTEAVINRPR
ncbi:MAG: dihydropteroate synthase [Oscillospiraceae bacterium]|jgi:dihydropteroate synthase|nr:dihydropteroate synthase [Oscillospiraceae bacterium]